MTVCALSEIMLKEFTAFWHIFTMRTQEEHKMTDYDHLGGCGGSNGPLYLQIKEKEVSRQAWQGESLYSTLSNTYLGREASQAMLSMKVPPLADFRP